MLEVAECFRVIRRIIWERCEKVFELLDVNGATGPRLDVWIYCCCGEEHVEVGLHAREERDAPSL